MRIAVASGKGGTGKTTVATNLAKVASQNGRTVAYLDCDVEEPNGHIFLKPHVAVSKPVGHLVPQVDPDKCTGCGECSKICQFSAIVCLGKKVLVFPEMCHACGGCALVCSEGAITEARRETGNVEIGQAGAIRFVSGTLNVGEPMSAPVIKAVRATEPDVDLVIIDSPPGTSCQVIESVRGADLVLLVTEPTPFGLHDLTLAVAMVRALGIPFGVVINRAGLGDHETRSYCDGAHIDVLAEIPDDRKIAEAYSRGAMACDVIGDYRTTFEALLDEIGSRVT